ncbi:MAG: hypothetical protein KDD67_14480 [Ignavibacteriae bacterium]|nr:hypothetical protein [Ignavibacteriota bacterium]MCB9215185.1 hypothetical protein [Ignavibacteria bacterium]
MSQFPVLLVRSLEDFEQDKIDLFRKIKKAENGEILTERRLEAYINDQSSVRLNSHAEKPRSISPVKKPRTYNFHITFSTLPARLFASPSAMLRVTSPFLRDRLDLYVSIIAQADSEFNKQERTQGTFFTFTTSSLFIFFLLPL